MKNTRKLMELIEVYSIWSGKIHETVPEEMFKMISINMFRCLPPSSHENTSVEASALKRRSPFLEPSWPHLQLVYELLLRYVVSQETDTKVSKPYIDHSFVMKLLDLFNSEDPWEREYLTTILPRIYRKFGWTVRLSEKPLTISCTGSYMRLRDIVVLVSFWRSLEV